MSAAAGNTPPQHRPTFVNKVDSIFSAWEKPASPGCALGVLRGGKMIYSRGYGLADVEHSVPITPNTAFHIASVSKQFTAFAIFLLAQDGKLSIADDIRKYLPELHDFGTTITVRHLLYHTSGLRDQWNLLALAGWRLDDVITERDVLNLVWRQHDLNFPPGEEYLYSNTGYTLLGLIVKRVSGRSLREFTDERMFAPLGMHHTHFHENYGDLVKNRAYSYQPKPGGYEYTALSYSTVGPSSLFATVEDLARWDENFYTAKVGSQDLLQQLQIGGKLNNGKGIEYASGLVIREYRGLKTVEHSGGDAGFRTELLRFPDAHFSVITLCNSGEADPADLAYRVADIYLGARLAPLPIRSLPSASLHPLEISIDPKLLDAYVGDYRVEPGLILSVMREGNQLMAQATDQPKILVFPSSDRNFFAKVANVELTFDSATESSKAMGVALRQDDEDTYGTRLERVRPTSERLQAYAGMFYSVELDTIYTVSARDGKLFMRHPRGETEMVPTVADGFDTAFRHGEIEYQCSKGSACDSFSFSNGRVRNLRFDRVGLKPLDSHLSP
jgi:CubicO group peptidase (beta-lactamase class C family)